MGSIPTLPGLESRMVQTPRIQMHVLMGGPEDSIAVLLVHGNASSATFWEETMLALPKGYRAIAPDLRGYGDTQDIPIDATRGCMDWVDDLLSLMDTLGIQKFHVAGHSLGGSVIWAMLAAHPERVLSATVICPGSPFGFGGTKDLQGTPCAPDFAGSGGGIVNPEFARLMAEKYRGTEYPASPRTVMNSFYWKPPFEHPREEELLSGLLSERIGPDRYPGDFEPSPHWPGVAPGKFGPANAISPKYIGDNVERMLSAKAKPPILWVRGSDDQIVSDFSLFDMGTLGKMGAVPGWPGDEVHPPQPMVGQTRYVLERYARNGGYFREEVIADTGHSPHMEKPAVFDPIFHAHLNAASS
ncbi:MULTISPECIES: alpha/beta hydrolase [unclassified Meiothermus]|uniref:alpha/beta hydrolase n=1 Tax=unclassified Meiothermus TaxID=370471 RepID=UPI000D7C87AC|nr:MULTISPECIES: alpha/beta hydrolase [unclassified Meiothermus]PZA06512.1 alpha/beta hydrolase [Meiothermus sp. Pnk-1]RYM37186.1 alpha/beta hydrolase [Meiothermus sp. PNK-Is4]